MSNVPNLDAMDVEELGVFLERHREGNNWKELFPEQMEENANHRVETAMLAEYANYKACGELYRRAGEIQRAQTYERICDRFYKQLPAWAKW